MNIIERLQWRYATKKFDENARLSPNKLEVLTKAFNLTATSYGLQPLKLIVVNNKEKQAELLPHAFHQRQVVDASYLLVICIERKTRAEEIEEYFDRVKEIRETPEQILAPFRKDLINRFEGLGENEIQEWARNQAYLALGNLMTVCAVEEIDSCPMEGFKVDEFDKILKLDELGLSSVLLLPVGYRAKDDMFAGFKKVRKEEEDSVMFL